MEEIKRLKDTVKTLKKKKYLVLKAEINQLERHKTFEIKLPSGVKRVTGIAVTIQRQ